MGHLCHGPMVARLSVSISETAVRLDAVLHRADLRHQYAGGRNNHRHYDSANHHVGLARDSAQCSRPATRGRLRTVGDTLGGDPDCGSELREEGLVRRGYSWSWARAWRNDGGHDGHRQYTADRSVA